MVNNNILKYCYTNSSGLHQVSFYSWSCIIDINNCYSYSYSQFIHDTFILFLIYIYIHTPTIHYHYLISMYDEYDYVYSITYYGYEMN